MKYNEVQVGDSQNGSASNGEETILLSFLALFWRFSQTEAVADSWFSGGKKKQTNRPPALYMQIRFFFCFFCSPPLDRANRALNMQLLCHYCHPGCLSANHRLNALPPPPITGYHPECHTPTIEPEADSDSWICRQCVFAVSTKVRPLISLSHTFRKRERKKKK